MGYTIASTVRALRRSAPEPAFRPASASRPWRAALAGAAFAALATLPGLGIGTLWDNSETAYGEVAREILISHSWVVMHFNGVPWFVQPPLYFWLAALFAKALGVGAFALRLPAALATIAAGGAVGYATATLAGERAGVYAALILSTSLMQAVLGRLAIMDALLDLFVTIGILAIFRAYTGGRQVRAVIGAAIAIAFGVLAKGPVALAIVLLVIVPWLLFERLRDASLSKPPLGLWLAAGGVLLAIDVPWFAMLCARAGAGSLDQLIGHYTFGRYFGTIEGQSGPVWYYVPVVILGFFPWIAYLPGAISAAWREGLTPTRSLNVHLARLAVVWAVIPFLFFSFAQTKLPNYIALELPALALLVALWFDRIPLLGERRGVLIATAVVPLSIGALAIAIAIFVRDAHLVAGAEAVLGDLVWMGAIVFVGSILTFALFALGYTRFAPYALALTGVMMVWYTAIVAEPHAEPFKPIPRLAEVIRANERSGDAIAIQGAAGGNALIFLTRPPVKTVGDSTDPRSTICGARRVFLVTSKARAKDEATYGRDRRELAAADNDVLLLYAGPPCR